jgi:hypothetical protein
VAAVGSPVAAGESPCGRPVVVNVGGEVCWVEWLCTLRYGRAVVGL